MKNLLTATAVIEVFTGVALLIIPSTAVSLLLGGFLTESSGILLGRICGVALISLSVACWMARNDTPSSVIIIKALVIYNMAVAALLLLYAVAVVHFPGIGLWPTVLLHAGLLVWCFQCLRIKR